MKRLPSIDDAGKIAVGISEQLPEPLNTNEQAFFIAGFQECVKYLSNKKMQTDAKKEWLKKHDVDSSATNPLTGNIRL